MTEHLAAREGVPRNNNTPAIWVDWSGFTAVWVCRCGQQGFGGMSAPEGRIAAMRHRREQHPDWPADHNVHIERGTCRWGETIWGQARGEACPLEEAVNGFCRNHNTQNERFEAVGMCPIDGCHFAGSDHQPLCATHLTRWIRQQGLDAEKARAGEPLWPGTHVEADDGLCAEEDCIKKRFALDLCQAHYRRLNRATRPKAERKPKVAITVHGKRYAYDKGCRCEECRAAAAEARLKRRPKAAPAAPRRRERDKSETPRVLEGMAHGQHWTYQQGCRCDECYESNAAYKRAWRAARKASEKAAS